MAIAQRVFEPGFHVQPPHAGGTKLGQGVLGLEDRVIGRQLRLAVVVVDFGAGQPLHHLLEDLHRHDRGPVVAFLQTGKIMLAEIRMPQHADPDGGRRKEHRRPVIGDVLQYSSDIRHHQDVGSPHPEDGVHEDVPLCAVIDGKGVDVDVVSSYGRR